MQPQSAASSSTSTMASTKRPRLGLAAIASSSSQPPRTIARAAGFGATPATPCPPQPTSSFIRQGNMMLVASEVRPSQVTQLALQATAQSRLPLKTSAPSYHSSQATAWHSVGVGAAKSPLASQAFFSPPGQAASQHHHKEAFRPRPSIASTGTSYSSAPASSVFSGRSSRIASVATTASYGSDEHC